MLEKLPRERASAHAKDTRIKICGITRFEDARLAAALGADFLGLVFAPSPRRVEAAAVRDWVREARAEFPAVSWVAVFVRPTEDELARVTGLVDVDLVQIHGASAGARWQLDRALLLATAPHELADVAAHWKEAAGAAAPYGFLVDSSGESGAGGTGRTFDWSTLPASRPERLFLAGGLDAGNVTEAIRAVRPFAVDASSRLESAPGIKDPQRVRAFFEAVRTIAE